MASGIYTSFRVAAQNGITNFKVLKEGTLTAQDLINQVSEIVILKRQSSSFEIQNLSDLADLPKQL